MSLALFLLLAALGFFLVSTRQFRQPERALIWLMGAGLLAWAIALVALEPMHYGLLRALWDISNGDAIARAFARNVPTVQRFIPQVLDIFLLAAALLGLVCLIAFTPGETIEKLVRPALVFLIGGMAGAVLALAVVAVGLGGQARPRTYVGVVSAEDVHDGDTLLMGEVSLRLWGVDAPEIAQECRDVDHCGTRAQAYLASLVDGALLQCDQRQSARSARLVESFGRPLVRCWARRRGQAPVDLGARMIAGGYAVPYRGEPSYGYDDEARAGRGLALMRGCWLRPDIWRNDSDARRAFEAGRPLPEGAVTVGTCPMLERSAP